MEGICCDFALPSLLLLLAFFSCPAADPFVALFTPILFAEPLVVLWGIVAVALSRHSMVVEVAESAAGGWLLAVPAVEGFDAEKVKIGFKCLLSSE